MGVFRVWHKLSLCITLHLLKLYPFAYINLLKLCEYSKILNYFWVVFFLKHPLYRTFLIFEKRMGVFRVWHKLSLCITLHLLKLYPFAYINLLKLCEYSKILNYFWVVFFLKHPLYRTFLIFEKRMGVFRVWHKLSLCITLHLLKLYPFAYINLLKLCEYSKILNHSWVVFFLKHPVYRTFLIVKKRMDVFRVWQVIPLFNCFLFFNPNRFRYDELTYYNRSCSPVKFCYRLSPIERIYRTVPNKMD